MKRFLIALAGVALLGAIPALSQVNTVPGQSLRDSTGAVYVNQEGQKATCSAGVTGLVAAASATDIFVLNGSATKTIRVTRIQISGRATAVSNADVKLLRESAAGTGGTAITAPTVINHDTSSTACTAVVTGYTGNPTVGTLVGIVRSAQLPLANLTTGTNPGALVWHFAERAAQAVVLRGVAQGLAVNLNGVTYSGNLLNIDIEWTEE